MREILFKGKRKDYGEWVEGYYAVKGKGTDIENHCICVSALLINGVDDYFYLIDYEVIPETVGQYTGLKDKNGKMIFEGDIVKPKRKDGDNDDMWIFNNFLVVLNDGCWELNNCSRGNFLLNFQPCDIKIIGNIHDNPELLKEGVK